MNLFEYHKIGGEYVVSEVSDEEGWKQVRDTLARTAGMGSVPVIRVKEWLQKENMLILEHVYDGRELELDYAYETMKHAVDLWDGLVALYTVLEGKTKVIICDEQKKISLANG